MRMMAIVAVLLVLASLVVAVLRRAKPQADLSERAASQLQWGLMAFVFGLSHLGSLLRFAEPLPGAGVNGRTLVLFLVFVTEMSDVLQYVWGKLLGRHKILPTISPNKTWEGFVG